MNSLQKIEDKYVCCGLNGHDLRRALGKDVQWKKLLKSRRTKIDYPVVISRREKEKYVLSTQEDLVLLQKIKQLEKTKLLARDKELVALIKSQLEHDWRTPLAKSLEKLIQKYHPK